MRELRSGLVSVIMPAHNSEEFLRESIQSVQAQTYRNWELCIVDDASSDKTLGIAQQFALEDGRVRILHLPKNVGVAMARNAGIKMSRGQYAAFLDSDDLWLPDKLITQLEFMRETGCPFSYTGYQRFGQGPTQGSPIRTPTSITYKQLLMGNPIGCLTVMIDRSVIPEVSMPQVHHEDYATWLNLLRKGVIARGIPLDLARYRVSQRSLSGSKWRAAIWTWNIYRRIEKLSIRRSVLCFAGYMIRAVRIRLQL